MCKLNHFKDVCKSAKSSTFNAIEKKKLYINKSLELNGKYNSVNFNSKHSATIAKLKPSSNIAVIR